MKVCLLGNRGNKNLGDELILAGMIKYFSGHKNIISKDLENFYLKGGEKAEIYVLTSDKKFSEFFISQLVNINVKFISAPPPGIKTFFKNFIFYLKTFFTFSWLDYFNIFKADIFVIGGGEIFTDECPKCILYFSLASFLYLFKLPFGGKIYLFGGIQYIKNPILRILVKFWIKIADKIYVRDFDSFDDIKKLNKNALKKTYFMFDHSLLVFCDENCKLKSYNGGAKILLSFNKICKKKFNLNYKGDYYLSAYKGVDDEFNPSSLDWTDFNKFIDFIKKNIKLGIVCRLHVFLILAYLGKEVKPLAYQKKVIKMIKVLEKTQNLTNINLKIII